MCRFNKFWISCWVLSSCLHFSNAFRSLEEEPNEADIHYKLIVKTLGLGNESGIEPELNALIQTLAGYMDFDGKGGGKARFMFEASTWNVKQRGEAIVNYFQQLFSSTEPLKYVKVIAEIPYKFNSYLSEMAPLDEWRRLSNIYWNRPDLLRKMGTEHRPLAQSYWRLFQAISGSTDDFQEGAVEGFLEFARFIKMLKGIILDVKE